MTPNKKIAKLRQQAEEKLGKQKAAAIPETGADTLRLLHELQVHQIELEMQNEELVQARAEAEAVHRQYTDLYDFAPVGYFTLARDGAIQQVNLAGANLLGAGAERGKLIKRRLGLFVSAQSRTTLSAFLDKVFTSGKNEVCEIELLKDGSTPLWAHLEAITDSDEREVCRLVAVDISERKIAEEYLERFKQIVASTSEGISLLDTTYRYVIVNKAYETFSSKRKEELIGVTVAEYLGEAVFYEQIKPQFDKCLNGETIRFQNWFEYPTLGNRFVEVTYYPYIDTRGEISGVVANTRDITERKRAEMELIQSEAKFRSTFDQSPVGSVIVGLDKHFIPCNSAFCNFLDCPESELIGKTISDITHPEDLEIGMKELKQMVEGKIESYTKQKRYLRKDGSIVWGEISIRLVRDANNEPLYFLPIIKNITERKRAEELIHQYASDLEKRVEERTAELVRASRIKDEFLANMSHELRTPLSGILGGAELLLEGVYKPLNEKQRKTLKIIHASGKYLLELINDILDLARIESGKFEIHPEVVDAHEICQSSLDVITQLADKKSIVIEYAPSPNAVTIFVDPKRLKQILINLLNNAVKFTPAKGTVKLEVQADVKTSLMRFSITDTGIGIRPEDLQKIFDPFVQVDSSSSRQYEGSGLGLALVKKLVDLHSGKLEVQSEIDKGSCFSFTLPWGQGSE